MPGAKRPSLRSVMAKRHRGPYGVPPGNQPKASPPRVVASLLGAMKDGKEYESLLSVAVQPGLDLVVELRRALKEIEDLRQRPCICYIANVMRDAPEIAISPADHLPFNELVGCIDASVSEVDLLLVTPGGQAHQVTQFVSALRPRFDVVDFLLPYSCMSAGTLWVCSGDAIWMDSRAQIGPIDPQIPTRDGRLVPAQSLLVLLDFIRRQGEQAMASGGPIPFHLMVLLNSMDKKEVAHAIGASNYCIGLASDYLEKHKFRRWQVHSSTGAQVTPEERRARAEDVAAQLCSHERWKAHGHAITRGVAWSELRIKIENLESVAGLDRAVRRFWALAHWVFDNTDAVKFFLSQDFSLVRNVPRQVVKG